jgi:hypothetical protein
LQKEWNRLTAIKDSLLIGIYANWINIHQFNNELILHSVEPIIEIRNPKSMEITYWKLSWIETEAGDDLLIINEQDTPEPLQYETIDMPNQKHMITAGSSYFVQHTRIKNVSGYGFYEDGNPFLYLIIIELEELYISIRAGAVIETRISSKKPIKIGDIIFTTT